MELPKKVRKPMMEKKRRARINDSLERLKEILLHNTSAVTHGSKPTKLEKADILEMTIRYIQTLQPSNKRLHSGQVARSTSQFVTNLSSMDSTTQSTPSLAVNETIPVESLQSRAAQNNNNSEKENSIDYRNENMSSGFNRIGRSAFRNVANINQERHLNSASRDSHWRPW